MAGIAEVAHDRADVHDPGLALARELGQQAARELHRRGHVGLDDAGHALVALGFEPGELASASVVDEKVEARKLDGGASFGGGEIGGHAARHGAGSRGAFREPRGVAPDEDQGLAVRRQGCGDGAADAAARAGEHGPVAHHAGSSRKMSPYRR